MIHQDERNDRGMLENKEENICPDSCQCPEKCEMSHHQLEYLKNCMPTQQQMDKTADLFKMFSDPTRLKILAALFKEEMCVCNLSDLLGISQSAISHQLRLLRVNRLVKNRREGKMVYYSLDDDHVATILAQGMEHVRHG